MLKVAEKLLRQFANKTVIFKIIIYKNIVIENNSLQLILISILTFQKFIGL